MWHIGNNRRNIIIINSIWYIDVSRETPIYHIEFTVSRETKNKNPSLERYISRPPHT